MKQIPKGLWGWLAALGASPIGGATSYYTTSQSPRYLKSLKQVGDEIQKKVDEVRATPTMVLMTPGNATTYSSFGLYMPRLLSTVGDEVDNLEGIIWAPFDAELINGAYQLARHPLQIWRLGKLTGKAIYNGVRDLAYDIRWNGNPFYDLYRTVQETKLPISTVRIPLRNQRFIVDGLDYTARQKYIIDNWRWAAGEGNTAKGLRMIDRWWREKTPDNKIVDKFGNPLDLYHGTPNKPFYIFNKNKDRFSNKYKHIHPKGYFLTNELPVANLYTGDVKDSGNIMHLYMYSSKPGFSDIDKIGTKLFRENEFNIIANPDYDGAILHTFDKYPRGARKQYQYVAKTSNQLKSAEPFTYDDSRQLIDITNRFNFKNPDIRDAPMEVPSNIISFGEGLNLVRTAKELELFIKNFTEFANKYGYEIPNIPKTNIEEWNQAAKLMLDRHNTFLRGVLEKPFYEGDIILARLALGEGYTPEQYMQYAATNPRTWSESDVIEPSIFLGDLNALIYGGGKAAAVLYPYKLGNNRLNWFVEGDTPIYFADGLSASERNQNGFRGILSPWQTTKGVKGGNTEIMSISDKPLIFKGWSTEESPIPIRTLMGANKVYEPTISFGEVPWRPKVNITRGDKTRIQLPSHTPERPREFVLDPQGDNKFYVHMRTWDGDHIPANISAYDKQLLFQSLYDELPEGAEILIPKSSPDYLATRGTVAGMLRLSRDPRFTPGTKGLLMYRDKDGSVKVFNTSSFIKGSRGIPGGLGMSNFGYAHDGTTGGFTPELFQALLEDIKWRMQLQGHNTDLIGNITTRINSPQTDPLDAYFAKKSGGGGAWFTPATNDVTFRGNGLLDQNFGLAMHEIGGHAYRYNLNSDYVYPGRDALNDMLLGKSAGLAFEAAEIFNPLEQTLLMNAYEDLLKAHGLKGNSILHEAGAINTLGRANLSSRNEFVTKLKLNLVIDSVPDEEVIWEYLNQAYTTEGMLPLIELELGIALDGPIESLMDLKKLKSIVESSPTLKNKAKLIKEAWKYVGMSTGLGIIGATLNNQSQSYKLGGQIKRRIKL